MDHVSGVAVIDGKYVAVTYKETVCEICHRVEYKIWHNGIYQGRCYMDGTTVEHV